MIEQREPRHSSRIRRLLAVAAVIAAVGGGSVGFAFYMEAHQRDLPSRAARLLTLDEKRQIATELQAALAARDSWRLKEMTDHLRRAEVLSSPSGNALPGLIRGGLLLGCHTSDGEYHLYLALHVLREMPTAPPATSS